MQQAITADELICPACAASLVRPGSKAGSGETSAELTCSRCGEHYPIIDGVPHFAKHLDEQTETAKSFGFAWKAFWGGYFDKESVFGLKIDETADYFMACMGIDAEKLKGAKVLDAGTG